MLDWLGLTTLLAIGYALYIGVCAAHIAGRLRRPPRRTYAWALSKGLPGDPGELRPPLAFEERTVEWRGVSIAVWDVRGASAGRGDGERDGEGDSEGKRGGAGEGPVVVLTPGWGDSRVGGLVRLSALAPMCSRIILWDPPGLGASEIARLGESERQNSGGADRSRDRQGAVSYPSPPRARAKSARRTPTWSMSTRDHDALAAVLDAVIASEPRALAGEASPARPETPVVLFGWSAGAGASIVASALSEPGAPRPWRIAGVIAEAPYRLPWTPARNVIRAGGLPWFLCGPLAFGALGVRLGVGPVWRGFDRASHAAALKGRVPLLVLHGADDEVCPVQDGRDIAGAAGGRMVEVPLGRHNDLWIEPDLRARCERAVGVFLERLALER